MKNENKLHNATSTLFHQPLYKEYGGGDPVTTVTAPSPGSPRTTTPTFPPSPSASNPVGPPNKRMPASVSCLGDLGVLVVLEVEIVLASVLVSRSLLLSLSPDDCESDVDIAEFPVRGLSSVVEVAVAPLRVDVSDVLCACAGRLDFFVCDCVSGREVEECWRCDGALYDGVWRKLASPRSDTGLDGPDTMTESVGVGTLNGSTAAPAPVPSSVLEMPWYALTGKSGPRWAVVGERASRSENVGERVTGRSMSNPCPRRLMRRAARLYHDARTSSALDEDEGVSVPEREWWCWCRCRRCLRRRRLSKHQTVTVVARTAITPTPTAIPAIAPALSPVLDTLPELLLGEDDAEAEDPGLPPVPVADALPDEDPDTAGRQLAFGPALTVRGGSPLESPFASVMSNCTRVPAVKLANQDQDGVIMFGYCCNRVVSELLSALSGDIFSL